MSSVSFAEKLHVIDGLSVQYSTQYCFGKRHTYLPIDCIHDLIINEVIFGVSCVHDEWHETQPITFFFSCSTVSNDLHFASADKRHSISTSTSGSFVIGLLLPLSLSLAHLSPSSLPALTNRIFNYSHMPFTSSWRSHHQPKQELNPRIACIQIVYNLLRKRIIKWLDSWNFVQQIYLPQLLSSIHFYAKIVISKTKKQQKIKKTKDYEIYR